MAEHRIPGITQPVICTSTEQHYDDSTRIKRDEMGVACRIQDFISKFDGKGPSGRPRRRWEDHLDVKGCELGSSGSRQDPVAGSCENGNEPSGSIKGGEFLEQLRDH
jgi:hypothetical protein